MMIESIYLIEHVYVLLISIKGIEDTLFIIMNAFIAAYSCESLF